MLNEIEIKTLVEGVWSGRYDRTKLPAWLFEKTAGGLQESAEFGWGNKFGQGLIKDIELETALRDNIYYFAASKTASQLQSMHQLMQGAGNKYNFVKAAVQTNEMWNRHWYETEFTTTQRIARSGREWRRIEESKDIYPMLKFIAVQDGNTRHNHAVLHGITRKVEDKFWEEHNPPLDWNCRCRLARISEGTETTISPEQRIPIKDEFKKRVIDSKRIWSENHPYFNLPADAKKAANTMAETKIAAQPKPKPTTKPKPAPKPRQRFEPEKYVFKSADKTAKEIAERLPNVEIVVKENIDKAYFDKHMGGFDLPQFTREIDHILPMKRFKVYRNQSGEGLMVMAQGDDFVMIRQYNTSPTGVKNVYHDYFQMEKELQGTGISKKMFQALYKQYKNVGIDTIDVSANLDVGGYTWGRYGFKMTGGKSKVLDYIKYKLGSEGEIVSDLPKLQNIARGIVEQYYKTNPEGADFPMNLMAADKRLKKPMLKTSWKGNIDLREATQRKVFEDYLAPKP